MLGLMSLSPTCSPEKNKKQRTDWTHLLLLLLIVYCCKATPNSKNGQRYAYKHYNNANVYYDTVSNEQTHSTTMRKSAYHFESGAQSPPECNPATQSLPSINKKRAALRALQQYRAKGQYSRGLCVCREGYNLSSRPVETNNVRPIRSTISLQL